MELSHFGDTTKQQVHKESRHRHSGKGSLKNQQYVKQYREFLRRLKRAREESGLKQVEVARLLGRPQSYISKCESGERRVDAVELQ